MLGGSRRPARRTAMSDSSAAASRPACDAPRSRASTAIPCAASAAGSLLTAICGVPGTVSQPHQRPRRQSTWWSPLAARHPPRSPRPHPDLQPGGTAAAAPQPRSATSDDATGWRADSRVSAGHMRCAEFLAPTGFGYVMSGVNTSRRATTSRATSMSSRWWRTRARAAGPARRWR